MFILNPFIFAPPSSLNNGLMFVYKAENNANDSFGTVNGTGMGGLLYSSGKSGNAFTFNGSTAYVDYANDAFKFTGDFSINVWVNISSSSTNSVFISNYFFQGGLGEAGYILEHTNTGNIRFYFLVSSSINTQLNYSYAGKYSGWHMITLTKVGGTGACKMYIDGALVVNNSSTGPIYYNSFNYSTIGVAKYVGGTSGYVENGGKIDEVGLWNKELTATEITELYRCGSGNFYPYVSLPTLDSDACAFIGSASITDTTQQSAINQLVLDLKSANIWTKMKAIYPFVGGTASQHRYNLKDPRPVAGAFYLDFYGGGTHSANGYQPDGVTAYADTKFIPLNNATDSNAHLSYYSRTNNTTSGVDIGAFNPGSNYFIQLWTTVNGGISRSSIQRNDTDFSSFVSTTRQGHFIGQVGLSGFNSFSKIYQDGVLKNTNNVNNTVVRSNRAIYIGALNADGSAGAYVNRESAFASIGDGLSDSEVTSFYNAVQAFQTTLGRQL